MGVVSGDGPTPNFERNMMATEKHLMKQKREVEAQREARLVAIEETLALLVKEVGQLLKELKGSKNVKAK